MKPVFVFALTLHAPEDLSCKIRVSKRLDLWGKSIVGVLAVILGYLC